MASVGAGEECDDGNDDDSDACLSTCIAASCGDGVVAVTEGEECDDGNDDDTDACVSTCDLARCGDGIVSLTNDEECDDGNDDDSDDCLSTCEFAFCGDGFVHAERETCDDNNIEPDDYCGTDCVPNIAGVSLGNRSTCIWTRGGEVKCWGSGATGSNGNGSTEDIGDDETPSSIGFVDIGESIAQLSSGYQRVCAVAHSGAVYCWGAGLDGGLGYGNQITIGDDESPASAGPVDVGRDAVMVSAVGNTCAVLDNANVRCWGYGGYGANGYGNTENIGDDEVPASVGDVDVGGLVTQISTGYNHVCALLQTGNVRCWGTGGWGQLGYGNLDPIGDDETPASAGDVDVGASVTQIVSGGLHTCALLIDSRVRCWGFNSSGQLGYGHTREVGDSMTPATAGDVVVGGPVTQLAAGASHTCALLANGAVRCWGESSHGVLGYGNLNHVGDDETPASVGDVPLGGPALQIAAGASRTCALLTTGALRCWGSNADGELGYGPAGPQSVGDDETPASVGDVPVL